MKEIGLRKVMGGQRDQIFAQFIVETVIIAMLALLVSYYLFTIAKPEFMSMLADASAMDLTPTWQTYVYFFVFTLLLGLMAGVVPAMYFARLTPIEALKPRPSGRALSAAGIRKGMLVLQFALSLGFILSVVIVLNQYRNSVHHDFGFDQQNILDVALQGADPGLIKQQFETHPAVQQVSMSSGILGTGGVESVWVRSEAMADSAEVFRMFTDEHYIQNVGLTLLAGSDFSNEAWQRKNAVVVNEEFLKSFPYRGRSGRPWPYVRATRR